MAGHPCHTRAGPGRRASVGGLGLAARQGLGLGSLIGHITQDRHDTPNHTLDTGERHLCREHTAICAFVLPMETLRLASRCRSDAPLGRLRGWPPVRLNWR